MNSILVSIALLVAVLTAEGKTLTGKGLCDNAAMWCSSELTARQCGVLKYCKLVWNVKRREGEMVPFLTPGLHSAEVSNAQPVKVSLYFESLCPGCKEFFQDQMYPTFLKLQSSGILEVELVPYGNAQERSYGNQWYFYCQHGPEECQGNLIETCGINKAGGDASKFMPFVHCLETYGPTTTNLAYCTSVAKLDNQAIQSCISSNEGNSLQHEMAVKTESLNPPHQYVPWITVNGYHTDDIQQAVQSNMLEYVCSTYQGTKPAGCNGARTRNICYKTN